MIVVADIKSPFMPYREAADEGVTHIQQNNIVIMSNFQLWSVVSKPSKDGMETRLGRRFSEYWTHMD